MFPIPPGVHWRDVQAVAMPPERGLGILPEPKQRSTPRKRSGETPNPQKQVPTAGRRLRFGPPPTTEKSPARDKPKRERADKPKVKIEPALIAKARELRDRYLERVNSGAFQLESSGRYDIARALPETASHASPARLLPAA